MDPGRAPTSHDRWAAGASGPAPRWHGGLWLLLAAAAALVLGLAAWLVPSPQGHGTHTQLGLPPCGFWLATGLPCPGCGLTTAFAHLVRGQLSAALAANAAGVVAFVGVAGLIPLGLWGAWRRRPVATLLGRLAVGRWLVLFCVVAVVQWALRLLP